MKRASVNFVMSFLICLFAMVATAQAGGFGLFEWGNAALGRGTAFFATGNDPSVIAFNPAQMTRLEGTQVYTGVTAVSPYSKVKVDGNESATAIQVFAVPHAYATHQVNDKFFIGVGEFTRHGLGSKYEDQWNGSRLLREAKLESFSFNPSVAYKVTDELSIAAGVEIVKGYFSITKVHAVLGVPVDIDVDGTSTAVNFGLLYEFADDMSLGFSYRSPMHFAATGKAEVENIGSTNAEINANFPSQYSLGFGYNPLENLTLEFDVIFTRWELFDRMDFDFDSNLGGVLPDNKEDFYYKNTWRFQAGAEYMVTDNWALRAGYVFDQTPTRHGYASLMLPSNDRHMFTLGTGYKFDKVTVDLAGMYLMTKERHGMSMSDGVNAARSVDFEDGRTWGLGLSVGYKF